MTRLPLLLSVLIAGLLVVGCGSPQVVVKPDPAPTPSEPSWVHLDRGPCPAPHTGGFCAVGRASGAYGSSLGVTAASAQARSKLAEWMRERISARFVGEQGGTSGSAGARPKSIDTSRLHVETVTTAVVGGISVPEWTFASPVRPGDPSGGDYVAIARITEDQVRDARGLLDQMQLDPEETQQALQAYDLFLDDLTRERERALARTRR